MKTHGYIKAAARLQTDPLSPREVNDLTRTAELSGMRAVAAGAEGELDLMLSMLRISRNYEGIVAKERRPCS